MNCDFYLEIESSKHKRNRRMQHCVERVSPPLEGPVHDEDRTGDELN